MASPSFRPGGESRRGSGAGAAGATAPPQGRHRAPSLEELAARVGAGDRGATTRLYERLIGGLRRYFTARLQGDAAEVENLAEATFVRLWEGLVRSPDAEAPRSVAAYAYGIARRVWAGHHRRREREERLGRAAGDGAEPVATPSPDLESPLPGPPDELAYRQLVDALLDCVRRGEGPLRLDEGEQAVVEALLAGRRPTWIARHHGLEAWTVTRRSQSACAKVRRCLEHKQFDGSDLAAVERITGRRLRAS